MLATILQLPTGSNNAQTIAFTQAGFVFIIHGNSSQLPPCFGYLCVCPHGFRQSILGWLPGWPFDGI